MSMMIKGHTCRPISLAIHASWQMRTAPIKQTHKHAADTDPTKLVITAPALVSFSTHSLHLKLKGQLVINYSSKLLVLLHKPNSLFLYHCMRDSCRILLESTAISLVFHTLMSNKDDLHNSENPPSTGPCSRSWLLLSDTITELSWT